MTSFLLSWSVFCLCVLYDFAVEVAGIHPAGDSGDRIAAGESRSQNSARRDDGRFFAASLAPGLALAVLFFALFSHDDQILKKAVVYTPAIELAVAALGAANILLAILFLLRRRNFAIVAGVVPVIFAMYMVDDALPFTPISTQSGRYLADQIRANEIPLDALRVANLKRAMLYGVNFYLHTDLRELNGTPTREIYVLTQGNTTCEKMPVRKSPAKTCGNAPPTPIAYGCCT